MKYYLITYMKNGEAYPFTSSRLPDRTISETFKGDWVDYVNRNGIKNIIFLKEITEDEYKRLTF